jgi:hypothetical protein
LKYEYDKIPLSGEKGFETLFRSQMIDTIPDGSIKSIMKNALFTISSPACFVFAYATDLIQQSGSTNEIDRFIKAVNKSNNDNETQINIPISGLCIWDRLFHYCKYIEPITNSGIFASELNDFVAENKSGENGIEDYQVNYDVVLRFICEVINTCNVYSYQRSRIPLEVYFQLSYK